MTRPPSRAVIEAVERAMRDHGMASLYGTFMPYVCDCGFEGDGPDFDAHRRFEIARAAEAAALGAIAGDWLIERTYGLSDEGIKGWPEINANAYRCAIEDAQSALRERADELTDTDDRGK